MSVEQQDSRRPAMVRNLIKYGRYEPETLAGLTDQQIERLVDRLKHCVVVSGTSYTCTGMHTG